MVPFAKLEGKLSMFILKLVDEVGIIHGQKLQRASISVMNRALKPDIQKGCPLYFLVQSEWDIHLFKSWRVIKHSEVGLWSYSNTEVDQSTVVGQFFEVSGLRRFDIHWHMSGDVKTLKCMYVLKSGPNAGHSCIYCMQATENQLWPQWSKRRNSWRNHGHSWEGGMFSNHICGAPEQDGPNLKRWRTVLSIPLHRVHTCTLHVHLHYQFVWIIKDKNLQAKATEAIEKVVSAGVDVKSLQRCRDVWNSQ